MNFISHAQIRDFEYSHESYDSRKQELEKLVEDQESLRSSLLQWCYTSYGEVLFIYLSLHLICRIYAQNITIQNLQIAGRNQADDEKKNYGQLLDYLHPGFLICFVFLD